MFTYFDNLEYDVNFLILPSWYLLPSASVLPFPPPNFALTRPTLPYLALPRQAKAGATKGKVTAAELMDKLRPGA